MSGNASFLRVRYSLSCGGYIFYGNQITRDQQDKDVNKFEFELQREKLCCTGGKTTGYVRIYRRMTRRASLSLWASRG